MSSLLIQPITPANIEWQASGTPLATDYGDIYFSQSGGQEESQHVFIEGNQLPERWENLTRNHQTSFIIGETGFGTGLNFFLSAQLWLESGQTCSNHSTKNVTERLTFISIEKHPLRKDDFAQAVKTWPQFSKLSTELLDNYPPLTPGLHALDLAEGRVRLLVYFGDVEDALNELLDTSHPDFSGTAGAKVDAWFLDGFAPSKNQAMWQPSVLHKLGLLSKSGTSLATFTVAGAVRRGLVDAGFQVEKVPGYGNKREMIRARHTGCNEQVEAAAPHRGQTPWHIMHPPAHEKKVNVEKVNIENRKAIVIGGGLAGCHSAYALARRGWQVSLVERNKAIATEASGNPQAVLFTKLSHRHAALTDFALASLNFAYRFYQQLFNSGHLKSNEDGEFCGMLQLAKNDKERQLFERIAQLYENTPELVRFVNEQDGEAICGIQTEAPGLFFPGSGWLNPQAICQSLCSHPFIKTLTCEEVIQLHRGKKSWSLLDKNGSLVEQAETVIVANSYDASQFQQTSHLPIKAIRGQVSYLPSCDASSALKTVVCQEGYLAPAHNGQHCLGASFDLQDSSPEISPRSHQENLDNLATMLPQLNNKWSDKLPDKNEMQGRVSFRGVTPDYLPIAGPVPDLMACQNRFAGLAQNAKQAIAEPGSWIPGLFVNIGHGARGSTYAPLAADLLASMINNEPKPMEQSLWRALSPARFVIRNLIRSNVAK